MGKYSKEELREDFDLLIQSWLKIDNENTTYLADSLATYAAEKLNGEIRESCKKLCPNCNQPYITYTTEEHYQCSSCDHSWT